MERVATALSHNVHVGPGVTSVTGIIGGGLNLELLDGIGVGNGDSGVKPRVLGKVVAGGIVNVYAIHLEIVSSRTCSIHAHVLRAPSKADVVSSRDCHARRHSQDRGVVSGGKR